MRKVLLAATMLVGGGLLLSAPAHAVFVPTQNDFFQVAVNSTLTFTFVGRSANDVDLLINGATTIFNNQTTASGTTFTTVFGPGRYELQLRNNTVPALWSAGTANSDNQVHLVSTTTFSDFALGTTNIAPGLNGYYGWEDRAIPGGALTDYNDLVFTINSTPTTTVPEPMSLAVLGVGLVGAGLARMRKNSAKA